MAPALVAGVESDGIASDIQPETANFVITIDFDTLVTALLITVAARFKT
jgi:hypothetical protein